MQEYVVVYVEGNGTVLLVLKNRPPKMAGRLNLPGGKIESTDLFPIVAAVRELKEETGLDAANVRRMGDIFVKEDALGNNAIIHCVKIEVQKFQEFSPRKEETEHVGWYVWDHVCTDPRLMPNLRLVVPLMMANVSGWTIEDSIPSWNKHIHKVTIQIPTYI